MRARCTSSKARRIIGWTMLAALAVLLIVAGRPAAHLIRAAIRDHNGTVDPIPSGFADDASRLNRTAIAQVIAVSPDAAQAEGQLNALLERALASNLKVSIAGSRHTMGGHTISPGGIAIDMTPFNRIELDEDGQTLHVQAGAKWDQIIPYLDQRARSIEVMQSNNSFTVGGSISANCHGWQPNRPPIASTVLGFRLMKADGEIVRCTRDENAELFSLALGGYGLFGIILDVDLRTVPNERYRTQRTVMATHQLADAFLQQIKSERAGMAYARLCIAPDMFLEQAVLNVFHAEPCAIHEIPALAEPAMVSLKRTIFRGSAESDYGKKLRWEAELRLSDQLAASVVSRNQLLSDPVDLYQNHSAQSTDILHEYFVPPAGLHAFIMEMRRIIPRHGGDLLNVTVRHVLADHDSFMRYADQEMFALVLLFNQARTDEADAAMQTMTGELMDAALKAGGRYYLPYRLHASAEQFHAAYPQAREFFELKRRYDPHELFQNQFYLKYGAVISKR